MRIEYLSEFAALAQTGNYSETADQLCMTQSSLSKHIMTLEKELGTPLFIRTTRSICLSVAGQILLPYAIKIIQLNDECQKALVKERETPKKHIIIASTVHMVEYGIADIIAMFKLKHYAIKVDIVIERHNALKNLLKNKEANFIWIGETDNEKKDDGLCRLPFHDESLVALVNTQHAAEFSNPMPVTELEGIEVFIQDNSSVEQSVFTAFCKQNGFEPELTSVGGAKMQLTAVQSNAGVAVMLSSLVNIQNTMGIAVIPLKDSPQIHVNLVCSKKELDPCEAEFLRFVRSFIR